ncbi:hypothetical protein EMCRGX_G018048 [Ephydatia muelleri]
MRLPLGLVTLLVSAVSAWQGIGNPDNLITYDEQYVDGLTAYSGQKYADTITHFNRAMKDYNQLAEARLKCYAKCRRSPTEQPLEYSGDTELAFFNVILHRSACIEKCKEDFVGVCPISAAPYSIADLMERKEPYNYLQMAYYHEGDIKQAAKTAATYNYYNPYSIHTKANMKFYEGRSTVTKEDLQPLETQVYRDRTAAFSVKALRSTRMHNCAEKLGSFRQDKEEPFLGSYFHYMQYGYFNLNQSVAAVEASATQARLEPNSEVAKRNGVFYRQQKGVTRNDFNVRKDMLPVVERLEFEDKMLQIIDLMSNEVVGESDIAQAKASSEAGNDEQLLEEDFHIFPVGSNQALEEELKPNVVEGPRDGSGRERLVVDNMLTEKECSLLLELATKMGKEGDGYSQKSPHTKHEKFEGLNILDAAKAALMGDVNMTLSKLYLMASKKAKDVVAEKFQLKQPLYFSFTHLVCRTAMDDQDNRKDLSHPVHSDNCILDAITGECHKVQPAYTWRDYSAILYLNNDFEGGQFFFAHSTQDLTPEHLVSAHCGRMVGFSAGKENMHGVTAVTKGRRCAVALWFTLDPDHQETTYDVAASMLNGGSYL